jgi:hypothetical protein
MRSRLHIALAASLLLSLSFTPADAQGHPQVDGLPGQTGSRRAWFRIGSFRVTQTHGNAGLRGPDFGWKGVPSGRRPASPDHARWG